MRQPAMVRWSMAGMVARAVAGRAVAGRAVAGLALTGLAVLAMGGVAACVPDEPRSPGTEPASPFLPCPSAPDPNTAPVDQLPPGATGAETLPSVSLPCFTGGAPVQLAALGRATVINLWASWCAPCRKELPEFQRFTQAAGAAVGVLGVVTGDTRSAAASAGRDLSVTFPMVFDASAQLQRSVAPAVLPVTLFVDAEGGLRHMDLTGALTLEELVDLAREHLGVVIW